MKKILIILSMIIASPAFAACSITGGASCLPSSDLYTPSLMERLSPSPLQIMSQPNAFQKDMKKTFDERVFQSEPAPTGGASNIYDSSCQFGVCMPDSTPITVPLK